jgi:hypothetical protein
MPRFMRGIPMPIERTALVQLLNSLAIGYFASTRDGTLDDHGFTSAGNPAQKRSVSAGINQRAIALLGCPRISIAASLFALHARWLLS